MKIAVVPKNEKYLEEASLWCDEGTTNCADNRITYNPMFGLIPLTINIPNSTVTMPAESLGYQR